MSNTSSNKHEETHNSDTLVDETGLGGDVHHEITEVLPSHDQHKSRQWLPLTIVVGFLALCAVIGLAVGLTRESEDEKDTTPSSVSKGTWIPIGKPIIPDLDVDELTQEDTPPFEFWNFDTDGEHLVVADPNAVDLHPDLDIIDTNNGLVSIYQLGEGATFNMKFQASAGDMWGTTLAMDKTATYLAVGTPLASDMDTELSHTGVVHVYNLKALTLESVGRPLYGPHFLASLGSGGLAMSGDGKVLAATAAGQAWVWRWNTVTNDWSEAPSLGYDVGNQVTLNDDGSLLAHTTFTNKVVVYNYICRNAYDCGWNRIGVFPGSFVTLHGNNAHVAIGTKETLEANEEEGLEEEDKYSIQVYEFAGNEWYRMGSAIPGSSAEFMDDKHILVQRDTTGIIQTWQWAGVA